MSPCTLDTRKHRKWTGNTSRRQDTRHYTRLSRDSDGYMTLKWKAIKNAQLRKWLFIAQFVMRGSVGCRCKQAGVLFSCLFVSYSLPSHMETYMSPGGLFFGLGRVCFRGTVTCTPGLTWAICACWLLACCPACDPSVSEHAAPSSSEGSIVMIIKTKNHLSHHGAMFHQ